MLRYHLERSGSEDDPRLREIHTYDENVAPKWEDGVWRATCRTEHALNALRRRYGFRLVDTVDEPEPPPTPEQLAVARRKAHAQSVADPVPHIAPHTGAGGEAPPDTSPRRAWLGWCARHRDDEPVRRNGWAAADVLRAPVDAQALANLATRAARAGTGKAPLAVGVVLVFTGWGEREEGALLAALACAAELGPLARVVLVQNDPDAHKATRAWAPPPAVKARLRKLLVRNEGFAAACVAGAKALDKAIAWILFTQADAAFTVAAVRQAIALAESYPAEHPPLVGPSGGHVVEIETGVVQEWGRNVRADNRLPAPVDFVAGYWVLVAVAVYAASEGWDPGYFLFHEDPDLAFRCALVGARSLAWPALVVDHRRGSTIKARIEREVVTDIQKESRARFVRIWGPRPAMRGAS